MAGKVEERKSKLRTALIEAAEAQIRKGGLRTLKARALAQEAGCSVGAIYNIFDDLDALVMSVNARTFQALGSFVSAKVEGAGDVGPQHQMIAMAHGYLGFAQSETFLWRALFDLEMSSGGRVPEWYSLELAALFAQIEAPLGKLFPEYEPHERKLMVRALFSAVHGIVLLGLEQRISAVPKDQIETMLAQVLSQIGNS